MAGIYIPNMEMPQSSDVVITIYGDGTVLKYEIDSDYPFARSMAIPVPDHGRLIDADNLDYIAVSIDKRGCVSKIDAPTIIPAEEGAE